MNFKTLDNKNFLLFCIKYYQNPSCTGIQEFQDDLKRLKYIKKLITRYVETKELKERLILNHLIILNNVFGPEPLVRILCLKMYDEMKYLKPFLILLNILPEKVYGIEEESRIIYTDDIPMDQRIIDVLRKI